MGRPQELSALFYTENLAWTSDADRWIYKATSHKVKDGSTYMYTQVNKFDGHHIVIDDTDYTAIFALGAKVRVDLRQGEKVVARGIIVSPDQSIQQGGQGEIVLDLENITYESTWIPTGLGYRDNAETQQVVANLGAITKLGHSDYNYAAVNKDGVPGYDDYGRAIRTVTPGKATGWSATYVNTPGAADEYSSAPVYWFGGAGIVGGYQYAIPNANDVRADPANLHPFASGAIGSPGQTDVTKEFWYTWQVVDPQQVSVAGVSHNPSIGTGAIDFGFVHSFGTWQVVESGVLIGSAQAMPVNSLFAIRLHTQTGEIYYYVNGVLVRVSAKTPVAPFYPMVVFGTANGEITNAVYVRWGPPSQVWADAKYDDQTQLSALIQFTIDNELYIRQAKDDDGVPLRRYEVGEFGNLTQYRITDGGRSLPRDLARNPLSRKVKTIHQTGPDVRNLVNVATPLGGGTPGVDQVTIEHLYRIRYDPLYEHFGCYPGGYNEFTKGNFFPEYDPNYEIYATATDAGGWQFYMKSLLSCAEWDEMYGGTPDSTYTYQSDANNTPAFVELTERGLYSSWIGKFRKHDQPHMMIEITTESKPDRPSAGDKVTVDYTGRGYQNGRYFPRMRVKDVFTVMSIEITTGPEETETWVLSNLGRYTPDDSSAQADTQRTVSAMQTTTNTTTSISITGVTFRELDSGKNPLAPGDHSIIYPIKILNTCTQVQAAFFRVDFLPFRQTVYQTEGGLHTHVVIIPPHSHAPEDNLVTDEEDILTFITASHHHITDIIGWGATVPSSNVVGFINGLLRWTGGSTVHQATGVGVRETGASAMNKHAFTKTTTIAKQHTFDNITTDDTEILTEEAGLHSHVMTPMVRDDKLPSFIQVWIDSGTGLFVNRTAEILDLVSNGPAPSIAGFQQSFEMEVSRWINVPGKTVRIQFVSIGDPGNPYGLGALGISATIAASYGGIGQIFRQI